MAKLRAVMVARAADVRAAVPSERPIINQDMGVLRGVLRGWAHIRPASLIRVSKTANAASSRSWSVIGRSTMVAPSPTRRTLTPRPDLAFTDCRQDTWVGGQ